MDLTLQFDKVSSIGISPQIPQATDAIQDMLFTWEKY